LAFLYATNSLLGAAIAVASFASATAIIWPLLIASVAIGIAIAILNSTAVQQWIDRCYFSKNFTSRTPKKYFLSLDEELRGYKNAVGA
jgi:diacylglycerol kinase